MSPQDCGNASAASPVWVLNPDGASPYGCNATAINSNGTTTAKVGGGHYYGLAALGLGTLWTAAVYDVNGTATKTLAATLSIGALGVLGLAAPAGIGVRVDGDLRVVTAGTLAGLLNVLWD